MPSGRRFERDPRSPRPDRLRRHRPARRGDQRALATPRHPRRQCRHPRRPHADRAYHPEGLGAGDGRQRHGELAPDPLARPAAAHVGCRPRDLRHLRAPPLSAGPIGGRTRSPRRRSKPWSVPMRPRTRPRPSGRCCSIRALCAPACAARRCRARIPETLQDAGGSRAAFRAAGAPDWTETGKIYDFPTDRVLSPPPE